MTRHLLRLLILLPSLAFGAVAVDSTNVKSSDANAFLGGSYSVTMTVTCATSDDLLVVEIGAQGGTTGYPTFTSVQYNGVAMTFLSGSSSQLLNANYFSTYTYYMVNPPTGSAYALNIIFSLGQGGAVAIPISGVNTSTPFGTPVLASSSANNSAAITATGAGTNDLYIATAFNGIATMVHSGANQTNIAALNAFSSNSSITADSVPGVDPGVFSWTGSGTQWQNGWVASGVNVVAGSAATPYSSMFLTFP